MTSLAINAQDTSFRQRKETRLLSAEGWNFSQALNPASPRARVRRRGPLTVPSDAGPSAPSFRERLAACHEAVCRRLRIDNPSKLRPWSRAT